MKVALDAMGGDFGAPPLVAGAVLALAAYPQLETLFLVGDTTCIEAELKKNNCADPRVSIVHSTEVVEMSESAAQSVRKKKDSSIARAVELVKSGEAQAVVSAGHTGAAVASTTLRLRTLPGIDRPGIGAFFPGGPEGFLLIDAGANVDPQPEHLLQYAIMGSVYCTHVLKRSNPSIGLMSIGEEDAKGNAFTKEVFQLLRSSGLNFRGNIEGHDLFDHPPDVVVCGGFVGNVVLKCCEATARAIVKEIREGIQASLLRKIGGLLVKPAFKSLWKKMNPDEHGGSPLLGVNGICIIAHGGSKPLAIQNAIRAAIESIQHQINPLIVAEVGRRRETAKAAETGEVPLKS